MLGLLLNSLRSLSDISIDLSNTASMQKNVFGNGTVSLTGNNAINTDIDAVELARRSGGTLQFNNMEIGANGILRPPRYGNAVRGSYHPLIFTCSGTLTVRGKITSTECGISQVPIRGGRDDGGYSTYYSQLYSPVPMTQLNVGSGDREWIKRHYGWSANPYDFYKLYQYGMTHTFMDQNIFLVGAGSGGEKCNRSWVRHKLTYKHYHTENISCSFNYGGGGYRNSYSGHKDHEYYGTAAGGFVALYFENLIINGHTYGESPSIDLSRISANGQGGTYGSQTESNQSGTGGGCIIIAARTIILEGDGTINSNAHPTSTGRLCFMNNIPQLADTQPGLMYTPEQGIHHANNGINTYYWYPGYGPMWRTYTGICHHQLGGAGLALGFKMKGL